jgi:transposase
MRPPGSPEVLEQRRFRAIHLFEQGYQPVDIARRVGADRRSVRRWKSAYLKRGKQAIQAKPASGRPPRMKPRDKTRLRGILIRGAQAAGYATDLWTCQRVAEVISDQFKVHYHISHTWRILRALGFSPQKPERRAIERDEKAIRSWVQNEWPGVKKKPTG